MSVWFIEKAALKNYPNPSLRPISISIISGGIPVSAAAMHTYCILTERHLWCTGGCRGGRYTPEMMLFRRKEGLGCFFNATSYDSVADQMSPK